MRVQRARRRPVTICALSLVMLAACGGSGGSTSVTPSATAESMQATLGLVGSATAIQTPPALSTQVPSETQTAMATALPVSELPGATAESTVQSQTAVATISAETVIARTEAALAPETNPAGDIPDSQAFVTYQSPEGGYSLEAPEGWGRSASGGNVTFVEKFNGMSVELTSASAAPTAASAQAHEIATLKQTGRAVEVTSVKDVQLPGGNAVLVVYTSNSDPNAVTNKQVRLENNSYLFFKNGNVATLRLWAPLGADNVDQWQRMSQSFRWR